MHFDPIENMILYPAIEIDSIEEKLHDISPSLLNFSRYVRGGDFIIRINLHTDSDHIAEFFSSNWALLPPPADCEIEEADLFHISNWSVCESASIPVRKRIVGRNRRISAITGGEFYSNAKVMIRGLCSAIAAQRSASGFMHGASMSIHDKGVVITGASGSGKTTATGEMISRFPNSAKIINDDWGWAAPGETGIQFTGEQAIHIKKSSIESLFGMSRPTLQIDLAENFYHNENSNSARILAPRNELFKNISADYSHFDFLFVLTRENSMPFYAKKMTKDDLHVIEQAEFSKFYQSKEKFMDGSLLILNHDEYLLQKMKFLSIIEKTNCVHINNTGSKLQLGNAITNFISEKF